MRDKTSQMTRKLLPALGLVLSFFAGTLLMAGSVQAGEPESPGFPVYKPPLRGVPAARVGGGTRGEGDDAPSVYVLTPEHTGLTSRPQPVLFWYLSRPVEARYEFVLIAGADFEPLLETVLNDVDSAGIQRIALSDFDIQLKPDVQYQWSVAVVMDEGQRSGDILASGMIEYVIPPAGIMARVADARGAELVGHYADAGLWYDALQSLDELIRSGTDVEYFEKVRASLLGQVGLEEVAAATGGI